ncbi:DUF5606 domain-containing protein [Dysgonomonas sp. 511]|uniref:DUF5606 family protein n=1 Tax=Dysgonomonas sp. 511 TaxID=2302930 RepID=UPI0013D2A395|nr:DUF5606 domain-containing protein [Dysgonomonas sp. 511]NDV78138.1 hypothetical protein [Dysgonomonas sp. 511]
MLKSILSVSGKPGLFKLLSNSKNMVIVESLVDSKKMPIHPRDKVVSLGDISIYTEADDVPLRDILVSIKNKENGEKVAIPAGMKPDELRKYFKEILPDFDRERVYPTDIKKIMSWYNILTDAGVDFEKVEKAEEAPEEAAEEKAE